ncbi:MAG: DUF5675 family protein [Chitinispirillia bacterium]|nr:DUF5675 family protein [Chitinispirillia bacterium]MCL2241276.1 DUF5675 family protein [Chitinispirillia bacterium]
MKTVTLVRKIGTAYGTFGTLMINGAFWADTLEEPWKDNQRSVSCIPAGRYICKLQTRPSNGKQAYYVQDVPGRTGILIHRGNTIDDIEGCILLGTGHGIIKNKWAVINSMVTVETFVSHMRGEDFELEIVDQGTPGYTPAQTKDCDDCKANAAVKLLTELVRGA